MKTKALIEAIDTAFRAPEPGQTCWTWDFSPVTGNPEHMLRHGFRGRGDATPAEARAVVFCHVDEVVLVAGWLKDHIA